MSSDKDRFANRLSERVVEEARQRYSKEVVDHLLEPRNLGTMPNPDGHARISTECGDAIEIFLRVRKDRIVQARFLAQGCVTTVACASAAAEIATGKPVRDARAISDEDILESLGGLPEENEHCAQMASQTLSEAIRDYWSSKNEPWKRMYRKD